MNVLASRYQYYNSEVHVRFITSQVAFDRLLWPYGGPKELNSRALERCVKKSIELTVAQRIFSNP